MLKQSKEFFFSVEGETELWYLNWLKGQINATPDAMFKAAFDCKVEKNPLSRVKGLSIISKVDIVHMFDRESEKPEDIKHFEKTLQCMKEAKKTGKSVTYKLGYSNLAFDLWMVLHKMSCNAHLDYRKQYLDYINRAFTEKFQSMDEYKKEANFKRLLEALTLSDVWSAVGRANIIMKQNKEQGYSLHRYCGYEYYTINPSLSVGEVIQNIFTQCGVPRP